MKAADMVQRVRNLFHRMERWRESVTALFNSGSKIVMADASALHNEGEKLKIACDEMKVLRNGMKATRIWLGKVKKCNFESGATSSADVEKLIEEHDNLLISAPEEAEKLSTAVKNYCLCRRPYEGFMIGCDDCGEWYHGACIGMSETQAGRYEKFLCVRCGVKKVFTKSAASIASIVRKWTSVKDFKKARQVESQKHQRKVRKERKDIEKFESQISEFQTKLLNFARSKQTIHPNHSNGFTNGMQHVQFLQSEIYQSAPSHSAINNVAPTFESSSIMNSQQSLAPSMGNSLHHMQGVLNPQYTQSQDPNKGGQSIQNGEKIAGVTEGGTTAEDKQPEPEVVTPERAEEMGQKVIEWQKCIISCNERLDMLSRKSEERTLVDAEEEQCRELLKIWCIRVRRFVLAPVMLEQANASRPCTDGSMSGPMINLFRDAEALGIAKLPDVHFIANSLKCISWSCLAMSTLATRPRKEEIQNLVKFCDSLELPDEKAARVLKGMVVRTSQFQLKVQKALAPKPGENRPFNLDVLKSLEATSALLPFGVFESNLLMAALEDKGCRHCLCGGPNDGSFMLSCDKCELWFHGRCVGVTKTTGEKLDKWMCPPCAGQNDFVVPDSALKFNFSEWEKDDDESSSTSTNDIAPCAPVPEKLWPPFGLLNSPQALEALGEECVSIHDSIGDWEGFRLPDKHVLPMADHGSLARQVPIARPLVSVVADQTTNFVPSPTVHDYHSSNAPVNGGTMHSAEAIQHSYPPNSIQNGSVLVSSAGRVVSTDPMYQSSFATIKEKMMFKSNGFSDSKTILSNVTKSKCVDEGAHVVTPDFQHGLVDNGCVDNAAEMITSSRKDDNQHMPLSGVSHIEVPHGESSIGVNPSASIVSITKNEPTPSDVVTSALLATVKMPPKTVVTKSDIPVQSQSLNKCLSSTLPTALHGEAGGTEKRAESTSVTVAHLSGKTVRSPEVPVPVP